MSLFEDVMSLAVQLPVAERQRLAQALGVAPAPARTSLPMAAPAPVNSAAWRAAERGHAVLDTGSAPSGPIPPGPAAINGMWPGQEPATKATGRPVSLPPGTPVLVHTSVVEALAAAEPSVQAFWQNPPVEVRLATATYLRLLEQCHDGAQRLRLSAFVQPFAVLSLGPMASSQAVELLLADAQGRLSALDSLIAATALAHGIPLVTLDAAPFAGVSGLKVVAL